MRTHGGLTEDSHSYPVVTHDRKGREGKGREVGHPSMVSLDRASAEWMAADAANLGGGR